jgi:repressor LexA
LKFNKLERLMKNRGITFYRLSKETGISTVSFTNWKQGTYNPSVEKLKILAKYFNVPIEYFLGGD